MKTSKLESIFHHDHGLCEGKTITTSGYKYNETEFFYKTDSSTTNEWLPVFEGDGNIMRIPTHQWITDTYGVLPEDPMAARRRRGAPGLTVITRKRKALSVGAPNEERARQLLRRFIGNDRFLRYMRDGFIVFRAASGKDYQIFPGHGVTQVWEKGVVVERLCLVMKGGKLPPTDSVIMRMLFLEHDEEDFRERSIKHSIPVQANPRRALGVA
jgi:hypothetical protein